MRYAFAGGLASTAAGHGFPSAGRVIAPLRTSGLSAILMAGLVPILLAIGGDRGGRVTRRDRRSAHSGIFGPFAVHESHGARVRGVACI